MEAGTGIEPVYTDLQSIHQSCNNNNLGQKKYQDKDKTKSEPDTSRKPSSLSNFMKPEHKRMARMLGYSLTLGTADAWAAFIFVASARLSMAERGALAFCALNSLDPDDAELTAAAAIGEAGAPLPTFLGGMEEARFWASCASRSERKAYALACFEAMSATDQAAFHRHISEMEVAA